MVPGSTLIYGSSLMLVTRMPRDSRIAAREAAAMPFPREETTPPVTKTYLVIYLARGGTGKFTGMPDPPQIVVPLRQCAARGTHMLRLLHLHCLHRLDAYFLGETSLIAGEFGRGFH